MQKTMSDQGFEDPRVGEVFDAYTPVVGARLRAIRRLILDSADELPEVSGIVETLKWGQPSYLTEGSKTGNTIRIDGRKDSDDACAMYFHCGTDMVETCRRHYPDDFVYEGNRALVMSATDPLPEDALRHCIKLALTYHIRRRKAAKAA